MVDKPSDVICDGDVCRRVRPCVSPVNCAIPVMGSPGAVHLHMPKVTFPFIFNDITYGPKSLQVTPEEAAAGAPPTTSTSTGVEELKVLLGAKFLSQDGKEVDVSSVFGTGKVLALYFSAHCEHPANVCTDHACLIP